MAAPIRFTLGLAILCLSAFLCLSALALAAAGQALPAAVFAAIIVINAILLAVLKQ